MSPSNRQNLLPLALASFTLDHRSQGDPLQVVAKRYSIPQSGNARRSRELTLILTSGIGAGTEVWIPTIKRLYQLQSRPQSTVHIAHIWLIEAQNQGDAAILNQHVLKEKYSDHDKALAQYGVAVRKLLSSGLVDFKGTKVIAIGHSAGCGALILAVPETEEIPYHKLILVEPGIMHRKVGRVSEEMARRNRPLLLKRQDVWPTKEDVIKWMKTRKPWSSWHPEVMQALSDHGLRALPTAEHPEGTGVTTKQYKGQEATSFFSTEDGYIAMDMLGRLCSSIPVHIIWGDREDFIPRKFYGPLDDPKEGRRMASVSVISGTGHWVIQEKPDEASQMIFKLLCPDSNSESTARL